MLRCITLVFLAGFCPLAEDIPALLSPRASAPLDCGSPFAKAGGREGQGKDSGCCGSSLPCSEGSVFEGTRRADQEQGRRVAAGCTGS